MGCKFIGFKNHRTINKFRTRTDPCKRKCRDPGSKWGPPDLQSDALPIEKGGKKKKLRAENRALQAELTRLNSLQDNHDAEMQRMRKELEQNRKEQRGESDVSIHQNDKIAELNHENWSLKEENSSLMDIQQRSQQDTDFKETEIERLKSDLDGT